MFIFCEQDDILNTVPPSRRPSETDSQAAAPPLVAQCLHAFDAPGSLQGWRWQPGRTKDPRPDDGCLELRVAGDRIVFAVAIRPAIHDEHLGPLAHLRRQWETRGRRLLVCTRRIPERMGARLRALGIGYLDTAGTAWFEAPGVLVKVTGRAATKRLTRSTRLTGADLRLLHVLLRTAGTAGSNQRQLSAAAGIALGAVGKGLRALEARGLLRRRGTTDWEVPDRAAAQAQFAEGWATVMRRRLEPRSYRALGPRWLERLPKRLAVLGDRFLLGGELAAARLTDTLQTQHATLHVAAGTHHEIGNELDLLPDNDGPITLIARFGTGDALPDPERRGLWLAHPLLIHAELVAVGDERLAPAIEAMWRRCVEDGLG